MNPFRKSPKALKPRDHKRWVCPQQAWDQLQNLVENEENVVVLGVEGSGKSSLLNMFFSTHRCEEAAKENKLIFTADLSDTEDGNDLCIYLIDRLLEAAQALLPDRVNQNLMQLQAKAQDKSPKQAFKELCDHLDRSGYTTLLVMDGFENFVSSPNITQDQHDMLRSLLDRDVMRCVVATNYDLERTSLPKDVQGSLYLQKFQQKVTLPGFSGQEAVTFLQNMLADNAIHFNEKQINLLLDYTGGIPGLLEMSASHMYDMVEERGQVPVDEMREILTDASRVTLQRWCKYFTPEYKAVTDSIRPYLQNDTHSVAFKISHSDKQQRTAAARLCDRGLWARQDHDFHRFNSLLLQNHFYNGEYSPRPQAELITPDVGTSITAPLFGAGETGAPVVIQHATINVTNNNQKTTNNSQNTTIHNQIIALDATNRLLEWITSAGAGRENLATALRDQLLSKLPTGGLQNVQRLDGMSDAEYDALCDHEFAKQYSDQVVGAIKTDEDDGLTDISEQEQLTLDQRFREARQITRPELTDAILEKVSSRTGFYLKLSVVVEDALSVLKLMQGKDQESIDCSAQVILYGKAVEQQLKDSFFSLFQREPNLKTYQIRVEHGGKVPFEQVDEGHTSIGTYLHAIKDNIPQLSALCAQQGILCGGSPMPEAQWSGFWAKLKRHIDDARKLRNLSAHTSRTSCPKWEDVDHIAQLSFGDIEDGNIFTCCSVASDLNISLFGNDVLSVSEAKALEGTEKTICCTQITRHNGVHGRLEDQDCMVKISPTMAQQFRSNNPNVDVAPQKKFRVRLIEYKEQNGELFFSAQLLAPV